MGKYTKVLVDRRKKDLLERFVDKIKLSDTGCWLWTGARNKGYGVIKVDGRTRYATHIAWDLFVGPIPPEMTTDHVTCRNPPCVNPNHLRLLGHLANSADNWIANEKRAVTHCPEGHPYDENNTFDRPLPAGGTGRGCRACAGISNRANARYRRLIKKGVHTTYQEQLAIAKVAPFRKYKPRGGVDVSNTADTPTPNLHQEHEMQS